MKEEGIATSAVGLITDPELAQQILDEESADAITLADVGSDCYIVDDQTVAKTNGTNTRSVAGKVFDVDADGVWVDFR